MGKLQIGAGGADAPLRRRDIYAFITSLFHRFFADARSRYADEPRAAIGHITRILSHPLMIERPRVGVLL